MQEVKGVLQLGWRFKCHDTKQNCNVYTKVKNNMVFTLIINHSNEIAILNGNKCVLFGYCEVLETLKHICNIVIKFESEKVNSNINVSDIEMQPKKAI